MNKNDVTYKNTEEDKRVKQLVWNVIVEDINSSQIGIFNVFEHNGFMTDVQSHFRNCQTKKELAEKLKRSLKYYFWGKSQWEVIIRPLCEGQAPYEKKIDVFWQILNNWDVFLEYVWDTMQKKTRRIPPATGDANARKNDSIQDWRICETSQIEPAQRGGSESVSSRVL